MSNTAPIEPAVAAVFERHPSPVRGRLVELRALVFETAAATPGVGLIAETLKWGQPSYLTPETKSGTTIRIDARPEGGVAMYVHCQTNLVARYRTLYPTAFRYEGDRAVLLSADAPLDREALRHCIALALTYHQRKRKGSGAPA
jgi:hypothetical protein